MSPSRRIGGFFGRLLLIYGVLAAPWPGINAGYATLFSAGGNLMFRSFMLGDSVRFRPVSHPTASDDTHIHGPNSRTGVGRRTTPFSRRWGYLPTAFLVSLVLATPLPWRRRLGALLVALILLHACIVGELLVVVVHKLSGPELALFHVRPPWDNLLDAANAVVEAGMVMFFMVPVLIWGLVCFRRADWVKWFPGSAPPSVHHGFQARNAANPPGSSSRHVARRRSRNALG